MSYDKEILVAEKAARRACPIAYQLLDTLTAQLKAMSEGRFDRARTAAATAAFEDASEFCRDAFRSMYEHSVRIKDVTDEHARAVLETVGLMPESVVVCADCLRETVGSHECSAQRRSNQRWASRREARA